MNIYIPIHFPYGTKDWNPISIQIPLELMRENLSKHVGQVLNLKIILQEKTPSFVFGYMKKHLVDKKKTFDQNFIEHYAIGHGSVGIDYSLLIGIEQDLHDISGKYGCPSDIYREILFGISKYLQSLFVMFGSARLIPIILDDKSELFFNYQLSYLPMPWQDWFLSKGTLDILLNKSLMKQLGYEPKEYELLQTFISEFTIPFRADDLIVFIKTKKIRYKEIALQGRTLSDVIRLHPSHDMSLITGLLTALIEKQLCIEQELVYRFCIKLSNFFKEPALKPILKKIYGKRSGFFHTAEYRDIKTIGEFSEVYFLILTASKLLLHRHDYKIDSDSFDLAMA
ncbi:hypothetical protein COY05_02825 [Candidatus Peregrinibacteria bacterium CG_4_10_14_0_2_um_filter_38_24]|nr:MAG: hypothetical protein COY05_02825 [Candidatus Peregrinibacteria bacterium CG_4_10_14_0_2_um_filter_38_24]